jgi:iron complex transport system permease protein
VTASPQGEACILFCNTPIHNKKKMMKKQKENGIEQNRIHIHQNQDEVFEYRKKEAKHSKNLSVLMILLCIWVGVFFLSLFFALAYQQWDFSIAWVMKYASLNIENFYHFVVGDGFANGMDGRFYMYINIALVGAALAACGAVFQGSMRNVLVGPSTMGVQAGGSLGCLIYVLLFVEDTTEVVFTQTDMEAYYAMSLWERYMQQFFVLIGCFASVALVLFIATVAGKGKVSASAMLISGMVFSSVVSNISMVIQYYMIVKNPDDTRIETIKDMMMGNFSDLGYLAVIGMMGIPIIICLLFLICISGKLNLLSMGDDEATMLGINVPFYRNTMIIVGTLLTAFVTAFCGRVGFVGFMVPMVTRKIAGPNMKLLLPASMLVGAILLTIIYDVAYFFGLTESMNVITSSIGCIVMTVTLIRGKKGGGRYANKQTAGFRGMGM